MRNCIYIFFTSESATFEEFQAKQKDTVGLTIDQAENIWSFMLDSKMNEEQMAKGIKPLEFKAEGFQLLGEIGLLILAY